MEGVADMVVFDRDGKPITKFASTRSETFSNDIFRTPTGTRAAFESTVIPKSSAIDSDPEPNDTAAYPQPQGFDTVAAGTQTETFEDPNKFAPRNVIFAIIILLSAVMWIVGVCGVWALWLDHHAFCITTEEMGGAFPNGIGCLPGGSSLDLLMVAYVMDLLCLFVLVYTLKGGTWAQYKMLVLGAMNIVVQIFITTTDMFNVETNTKKLGSEAKAVAVGTAMLLVINYALILLLSPSDHTPIGRFLLRDDWPKGWPVPNAFRNKNRKDLSNVENGGSTSENEVPAMQPLS